MNDNKDTEKEATFQSRLLRVIFRWVLIFAVSALVLYGAFWAATHPNNRITLIFVVGVIVIILLARVSKTIRFFLFPSKRRLRTKSFEDEVEEYRNKPISEPETIGSISMRLGEDVRDVWEMGYSDEQVNDVLTGKYTLDEMYKMGPNGNTISSKGKEILDNKKRSM